MPKIHMQMKYRCPGPASEKVPSHHAWKNSSLFAKYLGEQGLFPTHSVLVGEVHVNRSNSSDDIFLQALLLLPPSKVTLSLREGQAKLSAR